MKRAKFVNEEYYHIYNRGVDKRTIFECQEDLERFFLSMKEFNVIEPIGSIYENSLIKIKKSKETKNFGRKSFGSRTPKKKKDKLVEFICYCLNSNHYHFLLQQLVDKGVEKFMHKLGTGYSNYFNKRYKRSGSLFQGRFKAVHVDSNEYLLHLSSYVNLNHRVHNLEKFGGSATKLLKSSWGEYIGENTENFCEKDIILDQFGSALDYKKFVEDSLERIKENKEIKKFLLE